MNEDPFGIEKKLIPAQRLTELGGKFGKKPPQSGKVTLGDGAHMPLTAGLVGAAYGSAAGNLPHTRKIRANDKKIAENGKIQRRNTNALKKQSVEKVLKVYKPPKIKGTVHRITDLGSAQAKHKFDQESRPLGPKVKTKLFDTPTKVGGAYGAAVGTAVGYSTGKAKRDRQEATITRQGKRIARQNEQLSKSLEDLNKSVMAPKSQPQGQRKKPKVKPGQHKDKPKPGKGNYVKAPLLRDKVTKPRWTANALINNPHSAAAVGAVGAAGALQGAKSRMSEKNQRRTSEVQGALVGGAAGKAGNDAAWYAGKKQANKGISQVSHKGAYGPYKDGPHQADLKKLSRAAQKQSGNNARKKAEYFHANYPAGAPGAGARKVMTAMDKKPTKAGFAFGGAALGAGAMHWKNQQQFGKRNMSQTEINARKKTGAQLTRATSAIGLGSLAALGAGAVAPKLARAGRLGKVTEKKAIKFNSAVKDKAFTAGVVSSGVGGLNGFNNASWQAAESRQRKRVITKSLDMEPMYGEIAKAWTPTPDKQFDAEANRHGRAQAVHTGLTAAAGGAAGAAAVEGVRSTRAHFSDGAKALKHSKNAAKLGGVAGGTLIAASAVGHARKSKGFQTYSK